MVPAGKIGFVTERLLLGFGVDLVVHNYANRLAEKGYNVTVFCLRSEPDSSPNYRVVSLNEEGIELGSSNSRNTARYARYLNKRDIDVWVVHTSPFYEVCQLLRAPCVVFEYGTPPGSFFDERVNRILTDAVAYRMRYAFRSLRSCDRIVTISEDLKRWLGSYGYGKVTVVYPGCDHYPLATVGEAAEFRRALGVGDDIVLVLWVGRVQVDNDEQPYKGFSEFVDIAQELMERHDNVRVAIVGRGGEKEKTFLEERGLLPSLNLPDDKMGAAYAAADIFANTSRWEGFNLPLVEAQIQGAPVVAYDIGPHPEVTRPEQSAILASDRNTLPQAIEQLVTDDGKRHRFSTAARKFGGTFTWQRSTDELEAIIRELDPARVRKRRGGRMRGFMSSRFGIRLFIVLDAYRRDGAKAAWVHFLDEFAPGRR